MNAEQFAYWLRGWVELGGRYPSPEQWQIIEDHLNLVHRKETPIRPAIAPFIPTFPRFDVDTPVLTC